MTNPSIYVGTYAKYNNGSIQGAWLDLTEYSDLDTFLEACAELHKDEADPEFMFQDYENFPSEFYSESSLNPLVFEWMDLSEDEQETVTAFIECYGMTNNLLEDAQNAFVGSYDSDSDFAYETVQSCYELPEPLASYFDYDRFARDLMVDHSSANGKYFNSNW